MIEILVVALLGLIWFNPRWPVLNKAGIILVLSFVPSVALAWFIIPEHFTGLFRWWTAYLAFFLVLGASIVYWRVREDRTLERDSRRATTPWSPMVAEGASKVAKFMLPWGLAAMVLLTATFFVTGARNPWLGVFLGALIGLGPVSWICVLWLIVKIADLLTSPH